MLKFKLPLSKAPLQAGVDYSLTAPAKTFKLRLCIDTHSNIHYNRFSIFVRLKARPKRGDGGVICCTHGSRPHDRLRLTIEPHITMMTHYFILIRKG